MGFGFLLRNCVCAYLTKDFILFIAIFETPIILQAFVLFFILFQYFLLVFGCVTLNLKTTIFILVNIIFVTCSIVLIVLHYLWWILNVHLLSIVP